MATAAVYRRTGLHIEFQGRRPVRLIGQHAGCGKQSSNTITQVLIFSIEMTLPGSGKSPANAATYKPLM